MSNELTLVMQTPVEELVPKLLAWNNQELLAAVRQRLTMYQGITYSENEIATAKADKAQLNAFCKSLNDERIRIGKVYSSPYDKFKAEVDEVIGEVKTVVGEIDAQVKAYEQQKQAEKQNSIIEYYKTVVGEFDGLIPYERIHSPKWLNATTSLKSIKADIDSILTNARNAIVAIEALKSENESQIKAFFFRTLSLSDALTENERLKAESQRIAELAAKKEAEQATAAAQTQQATVEPAVVTPKRQTVRFQVEGTIEQLKALQRFLKENNIKYSAIKED